ncbi:hypothetical protein [Pedobacter aquatilis]|uniref:hypothetical protein n=1 Tax=Pedobacter aquatilis TaxID=351343 RepID=UPI0029306D39|nr:hypothetical protein [Pedobacter aquatilis]
MKSIAPIVLVSLFAASCSVEPSEKTNTLDSLKKVYADKPIHINLHNTESGTAPLTSTYAYTDRTQKDFAFELKEDGKYKVAWDEQLVHVITDEDVENGTVDSDMVLIEQVEAPNKRGYVSAKFIDEFGLVHY